MQLKKFLNEWILDQYKEKKPSDPTIAESSIPKIFYHTRNDGTDNFKEITQKISRHFKPQNKNIMWRKLGDKNHKNIIPQNKVL